MKRCPTCEKTFDDNLRFCQADGTPLVDAVEEIDPYKTMVAKPGEIFAAIPPEPTRSGPPVPQAPAGGDDVLELPAEHDANKTQIVSEAEIRAEMAKADVRVESVAPAAEVEEAIPAPAPPKFIDPTPHQAEEPPPPPPVAAAPQEPPVSSEPPPSPFSNELRGDPFQHTTPPIPSPFGEQATPMGAIQPEPEAPQAPQFAEPEPTPPPFIGGQVAQEHEPAAPIAQAEWTPPAAPDASWEGKELGKETPFAPPPEGTATGQSKTLAIVSLISGILGVTFCCGIFLPSLIAIITGFMARGRASKDPANYGGSGIALFGLILGVLGLLFSIGYWIFLLFFGGLELLMQSTGGAFR